MRLTTHVRIATALMLTVAAGTTLSACAVSIDEPAATGGSDRGDAPGTDSAQGEQSPATTGADTKTDAPAGFTADAQERRDILVEAATTTMPCPDGPLTTDGAVVRVEGPCPDLVIEIDAGAVIADDVDTLTLSGSGTTVYVDRVKSLTVTGSASSVFWAGETPTVTDRGAANVLRRG
ncbi:MAG: DUF3060 domain-containing protein [Microbacterium sp.]|nr:DUF3060 domain-containing protein [Microbacterium sp.]